MLVTGARSCVRDVPLPSASLAGLALTQPELWEDAGAGDEYFGEFQTKFPKFIICMNDIKKKT